MATKAANDNAMIEQLLTAEAFPHPVAELQLLETHISWIILTGEFAYKIKKPVVFDFVDYSTLQMRQQFCEQEVQLNRRFAPELYLGVVPILPTGKGLRVGEETTELDQSVEPIEYAVKMREFPQSAIVASQLQGNLIDPIAIDRLGQDIARFHESVEVVDPQLSCVQFDRIEHDALDNFHTLLPPLTGNPRAADVRQLESWTRTQLRLIEAELAVRLRRGCVRRCHGDMHLKNIIHDDTRLLPFDGIEFNEEFQWIDVFSEIAFPVMDFVARGRADWAWRLLNAYLEATGDYQHWAVLRYYLVYRAMVRAKVTWLNPHNHPTDSSGFVDDDLPYSGPWDKYLKTAGHFAFDLQPQLAITHGFSGSGKSTAALNWIQQFGGIRVRSDAERNRLTPTATSSRKYSAANTDQVYQRLLLIAEEALRAGFPVVIDATFLKRNRRQEFRELASRIVCPFTIIDCTAPFEELRRRIRQRRDDPSEATEDVLRMQMESHDPFDEIERQFLLDPASH